MLPPMMETQVVKELETEMGTICCTGFVHLGLRHGKYS